MLEWMLESPYLAFWFAVFCIGSLTHVIERTIHHVFVGRIEARYEKRPEERKPKIFKNLQS